jgi:Uncharacterised nucleotidyltransferase
VLRRAPFGIPKPEQVPELVELVTGRPVEPAHPAAFRDAVAAHRVTGFADSAIKAGRLLVPEETARQLRDAHAFASLRAGLLRRELGAIVPRLADACGTEPLVFKGPAVAESLYEPRTLRPFTDLDLLVPRARIGAATEALGAIGYWPNLHLRPGFGERYRHDVHLSRRHGRQLVGIDLHWRVSDDPLGTQLDYEGIEPARLRIDGVEVACPNPADHLIVLAIHFLGDRQRRLLWIEDIRRAALAADDRQWNLAFERADRRGLSWVLNRALDYAAHHLGLERERPASSGTPPPWGPLRAVEAYDFAVAWDVGHLTSIPWRERPGYLRAMLLPTREGLRGAAADPDTPIWRLALSRAGRAFAGIRPWSR